MRYIFKNDGAGILLHVVDKFNLHNIDIHPDWHFIEDDFEDEVHLPKEVQFIAQGAFSSARHVRKIYLHDGVKDIPKQVFTGMDALEFIRLPADLAFRLVVFLAVPA